MNREALAPVEGAPQAGPLVEIRGLRTAFFLEEGTAHAVRGVDLDLPAGRTVGLVGESGCGKSVLALSILRLIAQPPGRILAGSVRLDGVDLLALPEERMREVRGRRVAMIFQEPMSSLNPVFTIGHQIAEGVLRHRTRNRAEAQAITVGMLDAVGIPNAERRAQEYPHQLSGGMRQRAMIAMALACRPALLIADEPTTALDVTIQAQILALLGRLQAEFGMAVLLITHDLGVVAQTTQEVAVMYAGRIVEKAPTPRLFRHPTHPYTLGLFRSIPRIGARTERLDAIPGSVPSPMAFPSGCAFRDRCPRALAVCAASDPVLRPVGPGHWAACHWVERQGGVRPPETPS